MSTRSLNLTDELHAYLLSHSLREDAISRALRETTMALSERGMLSSPEQVQLLTVLARLIGAKRLIERQPGEKIGSLDQAAVGPCPC